MSSEGSRQTAAPAGQDVPPEAEVPSSSDGEGTPTSSPGAAVDSAGQSPAGGAAEVPRGRVGDYEILGLIGEGGMGTVFRARQERPRREVALKLVRAGFASEKLRRRFEHEAEVLGRLQHDGIARIYEAGIDSGTHQPFFAMELIEGERLDEWAARAKPDLGARLRMVVAICEAVHYAHTKGVIHRDLKPANILITRDGKPKILDFGVARLTDADATLYTRETQTGQVLGTLAYMSPEQASGQVEEIDTRSDVYALGVIAYELLSGKLPLAVAGKPLAAAARVIAEDEPSRLSSADRSLRGDVETIVGKALAKEKQQRYDSAASLAGDINRYLDYEPITARPPSTWYNLRKFARRNKAVVGGVAASFLILLAGAATSTIFAIRANDQANQAEQARTAEKLRADELEQVAKFQESQLSEIDVPLMAVRLRTDILEKRRAALAGSKLPEDDIEADRRALEEALSGVNFTDVALEALEQNVFDRALAAIEMEFAEQPLVKARLLQAAATTLLELGLTERATIPQAEALALRRERLGSDHPDTLVSIDGMGGLLDAQGKLAEAETHWRGALQTRSRVLGPEHPDTLVSLGNLGRLLFAQGKLAEAEPYYHESLEKHRRVLGEEHPDTLTAINSMGFLLRKQGKLADAEAYYREALEKRRRVLGENHPHTLVSISNMAGLLEAQGKLDQAEPFYREALERRRRLLGEEHPDTLRSINNVGFLLQAQGKFAEAEPYFRETLEKRRRLLGEEHPSTLTSINNMGFVLRAQGKLDEAEPYFREALEKSRRVLGEDHPDTIASINAMGYLLQARGMLVDAERCYREAMEKYRRVLGDEHPVTIGSINNMGVVLRDMGRLDEAEPYLREALDKCRRTLGEDHRNTLASIGNVGALLQAQGKLAEAEACYSEGLEKSRRVLGEEHPLTTVWRQKLEALQASTRPASASTSPATSTSRPAGA